MGQLEKLLRVFSLEIGLSAERTFFQRLRLKTRFKVRWELDVRKLSIL
jgi:hypothetical protein